MDCGSLLVLNFETMGELRFIVINIFVLNAFSVAHARIEFTNIKCNDKGKELVDIFGCQIVAVNRTFKYITMKAHLVRPVVDAKVNFASMKRLNGYKPFMYNQTYDGCEQLRTRKANPVVKFFYSFFAKFSNLNHTCPFSHDIIVDKLSNQHLNNKLTGELPVPHGDYALYSLWYLNGKLQADVRVYVTIS